MILYSANQFQSSHTVDWQIASEENLINISSIIAETNSNKQPIKTSLC